METPRLLELIRELAVYMKAQYEVSNTVEMMEKDGFGTDPIFSSFVAEEQQQILDIDLYYYRYSTWKG